mmetsp:Transcript_3658/g.10186  ORF Transcript_3658/g.10186 Transcript_3658/m.10186 type:complete len:262 (-) Transcript_3658:407-1192(-)
MSVKIEQWSITRSTFFTFPSRKNEWYKHELVNVINTAAAKTTTAERSQASRALLETASRTMEEPARNAPTMPMPCVIPLRISDSTWLPSRKNAGRLRASQEVETRSTPRCSILLLTRSSERSAGAQPALSSRAITLAPPGPIRFDASSRCSSAVFFRAPSRIYAAPASRSKLRETSSRFNAHCGEASSSPMSIADAAVSRNARRSSSVTKSAASESKSSMIGMSSSSCALRPKRAPSALRLSRCERVYRQIAAVEFGAIPW